MPANIAIHFQTVNQSSSATRKTESKPSAEPAQNPGSGFEAVLRDVRQAEPGQDIAAASGKNMPPGDLQKYALGPRVKIITSSSPPPDEQSLLAFARAEGIDEALLKLILGKKDAPSESKDSSAPAAAMPPGGFDPTQAMPFGTLAQAPMALASLGFAAEPIPLSIQRPDAQAAAGTPGTASYPGRAPGVGAWLANPASAPEINRGALRLPLPSDAAVLPDAGTDPLATTATPDQSKPRLSKTEGIATGPLTADPEPISTLPGAPPLALSPARPVPDSAGIRAISAIPTQSSQSTPTEIPDVTLMPLAQAPAPTGPGARANETALQPYLAGIATPGFQKAITGADRTLPEQTAVDQANNDSQEASGPSELVMGNAVQEQGHEGPWKGTAYERLAMLVRQENQKSDVSKIDGGQTTALREVDAPAAMAALTQWTTEDASGSAYTAASGNHPQPHGGAAEGIDLGAAAPTDRESMQDARFRRSEQYQALSDRASEAIGQRLSAQIAKGAWQLNLRLSPAHLGKIDIRLGMRESGTIDAEFNVSQAHTQDLLLNGLPRLKEVMAQSGMDLSTIDVKHDGASAHEGNAHTRQPLHTAGPAVLRDQEAPAAQITAPAARIGVDGLDVTV